MTRRSHWAPRVAVLSTALLVLSACGLGESEPERAPHAVEDPLPKVDVSSMRLPTSVEGLEVVDPGWVTEPQFADGVYLAARESAELLEFTAVDVHGDILWAAERPVSCTGFALTTDDRGRALAVLTDTATTDDALAGTTATAYDLHTGEEVWGPVEAPGPHHGPGLVFAAPPPEAMGEDGPRVALSAATGEVVAAEPDDSDARVIGEYHGTVLLGDGDDLGALDANTEAELWSLPMGEHTWDSLPGSAPLSLPPDHGRVLLTDADDTGAVVDIDEGTVISDTAEEAALDLASDTLLVLDEEGMHAFDAANELLWELSVASDATIEAAGSVLVYVRKGSTVRVHNIVTGSIAEAYDRGGDGPILVPSHLTIDGAGLLRHGQDHLLATIPAAPDEAAPEGQDASSP